MRKIFLILVLVSCAWSGIKEDFFHTGLSAKALAMGGTAFGFGVDSLYSNPAGLAVIPEEYYAYSYKTAYDNLLDTMSFQYMRPYYRGAWGLGLVHMNNSDADKTEIDEFDRPLVVGKFSERQLGLSCAYAMPLWGDSAVGVGARYYNVQLAGEQGQSLGFFAGYIKQLAPEWLYGFSVNNLSLSSRLRSTPIIWSTGHTDYFPFRLSNSLAHRRYLFGKQTEFFVDLHTQEVNENGNMATFYSLGTMVWIVPKFFNCRAGINDENLSLGLGLRLWDVWGMDYAYVSHQYLGGSHFISFSYKPGQDQRPVEPELPIVAEAKLPPPESQSLAVVATASPLAQELSVTEDIPLTTNLLVTEQVSVTENTPEVEDETE